MISETEIRDFSTRMMGWSRERFHEMSMTIDIGLQLDRVRRRNGTEDIAVDALIIELTEGLLDASKMLEVKIPYVELLYPWEQEDPNRRGEATILATASLRKDGYGLIRIAPDYMDDIITAYRGEEARLPSNYIPPRALMAHESRHLRQLMDDPDSVKRDCQLLGLEGEAAYSQWNNSPSELNARDFEAKCRHFYLKVRQENLVSGVRVEERFCLG
ncbi:MAG: hypothetical protein HYT09_01175 [Candidatus Levybacteria bacterium]|nr:hypothetical protein [Candidatus Levybacteria bacterium]